MKRFFVLMLVIIISACSDKDPVPSSKAVFPLETGNYWIYLDTLYINGAVYPDTASLYIGDQYTILYEGRELELFSWSFEPVETSTYGFLCANQRDGLYFYGGVTQTDTFLLNESLRYKYPVELGEQWEELTFSGSDNGFSESGNVTRKCLATNVAFRTPIKKYNTIEYFVTQKLTENITNYYHEYVVPGVGLVG